VVAVTVGSRGSVVGIGSITSVVGGTYAVGLSTIGYVLSYISTGAGYSGISVAFCVTAGAFAADSVADSMGGCVLWMAGTLGVQLVSRKMPQTKALRKCRFVISRLYCK
jgi:hypothetical protein